MSNRGRIKYVPRKALEELNWIKHDYNLSGKRDDSEAFKKMAEFSIVGREVDNMRKKLVLADLWGKRK